MRVVGGVHRSRTLKSPRGASTRPTSDRVREALFSLLNGRVEWENLAVLDLYAGTGALALEALSRGAHHATLVESAPSAIASIRANMSNLDLTGQVTLLAIRVEQAAPLLVSRGPFDLIFIDPPYAQITSGVFATLWHDTKLDELLATDGLVILEHATSTAPPELNPLELESTRRYGDTSISLYARTNR